MLQYRVLSATKKGLFMAQSSAAPSIKIEGGVVNKKLKFIIGGVVMALALVYLIYSGIQNNATYFLTVDELYAKGTSQYNRPVRVSGLVDAATIQFNNHDLILTFDVTSEAGGRMHVIFNGPQPDQMRAGAEAILEGKYDGQTFTAQSLLLKCPSRYEEGTIEQVEVKSVK
jgi:cytochrome c-type biogenesis protein CcmE